MTLTLNTILRINNTLIQKEHNGTIYIVDPTTETIHTLNETASAIWRYLYKPRSIKNIIRLVTEEFDVGSERAKEDVIKFLTDYFNKNLLNVVKK
ncbi:PqqD family protein [Candidatus Gottesmanbacteria bacterium]|nr:PqqD family protein [Candidatus Gottesmanbacteria bacterium]